MCHGAKYFGSKNKRRGALKNAESQEEFRAENKFSGGYEQQVAHGFATPASSGKRVRVSHPPPLFLVISSWWEQTCW